MGASNKGRVELFHNGEWGAICGNKWDIRDAIVVCRQLGFPDAEEAFVISDKSTNAGKGKPWLDEVECKGFETSISSCLHHGLKNHYFCLHGQFAGVTCKMASGKD